MSRAEENAESSHIFLCKRRAIIIRQSIKCYPAQARMLHLWYYVLLVDLDNSRQLI